MNRRDFIRNMAIAAAGISAAGILGGAAEVGATAGRMQGKKGKMKILVLTGSPRKGGNSDLLCDEFMRGAVEAGNEVEKIRVSEKKIGYCTGCYYCTNNT